jgi:hypothetical protein
MQLNQEEKGRKTYAITMFQYYTIEQEDVNILMKLSSTRAFKRVIIQHET